MLVCRLQYSLGCLLYVLLTGRSVFESAHDSPDEWAYLHIAVPPVRVTEHDASIPAIVADIVAKLLAKNPDDRYQSCAALSKDLMRCAAFLQSSAAELDGRTLAFQLAEKDVPPVFVVPMSRLYGREKELQECRSALNSMVSVSHAFADVRVVIVSGPSGSGKSALLKQVPHMVSTHLGIKSSVALLRGKFAHAAPAPMAMLNSFVCSVRSVGSNAWDPRCLLQRGGRHGPRCDLQMNALACFPASRCA